MIEIEASISLSLIGVWYFFSHCALLLNVLLVFYAENDVVLGFYLDKAVLLNLIGLMIFLAEILCIISRYQPDNYTDLKWKL